jgi:hypothetical protein
MKLEGRVYLRDIGEDMKKILKLIDPKEKDAVLRIGLICLKTETTCGLLCKR